jgi:hypothetical protein
MVNPVSLVQGCTDSAAAFAEIGVELAKKMLAMAAAFKAAVVISVGLEQTRMGLR